MGSINNPYDTGGNGNLNFDPNSGDWGNQNWNPIMSGFFGGTPQQEQATIPTPQDLQDQGWGAQNSGGQVFQGIGAFGNTATSFNSPVFNGMSTNTMPYMPPANTAPQNTQTPTNTSSGIPVYNPDTYKNGPYNNPISNYNYALNQSQYAVPGPSQPTSPYKNPFQTNPTENNPFGGTTPLNQTYWATQDTANTIAKQLGGTVVPGNFLNGSNGFSTNQSQYMVQLPDGRMVNPGTDVADLYNHGYSQSFIDTALSRLKNNDYPTNNPTYIGSPGPNDANLGAAPQGQNSGQGYQPFYLPNNPISGNTNNVNQSTNNSFDLSSLFGGQNPLLGLVQQLYGSNPFTAAFGNSGIMGSLGNYLSGSTTGNNMSSVAQLLNALYSNRTQPGSGVLSPLFWGSQGSNSNSNSGLGNNFNSGLSGYYPRFV